MSTQQERPQPATSGTEYGSDTKAPPTKRKPGGQPGNQNARKYGFYAPALTEQDRAVFRQATQIHDLQPEIAFLRTSFFRLASHPASSPETVLRMIRTIARLTLIQKKLIPPR